MSLWTKISSKTFAPLYMLFFTVLSFISLSSDQTVELTLSSYSVFSFSSFASMFGRCELLFICNLRIWLIRDFFRGMVSSSSSGFSTVSISVLGLIGTGGIIPFSLMGIAGGQSTRIRVSFSFSLESSQSKVSPSINRASIAIFSSVLFVFQGICLYVNIWFSTCRWHCIICSVCLPMYHSDSRGDRRDNACAGHSCFWSCCCCCCCWCRSNHIGDICVHPWVVQYIMYRVLRNLWGIHEWHKCYVCIVGSWNIECYIGVSFSIFHTQQCIKTRHTFLYPRGLRTSKWWRMKMLHQHTFCTATLIINRSGSESYLVHVISNIDCNQQV